MLTVYWMCPGHSVMKGEIYDYQGDLEEVSGITGKPASFRDLKDIYLSDGTILFTEDGYEQNGMQFLIVDSSYRGYTIYGDGKEHKASIEVSSGVSVSCTLEDVLLSPRRECLCINCGRRGGGCPYIKRREYIYRRNQPDIGKYPHAEGCGT